MQPQSTGQLINTQPAPQTQPDPNAVSLVPQPTQPQMNGDQAAASLAFATHLQGQMLQHQNPIEAPVDPQNAPGQEKPQNSEKDQQKQTDDLKKEMTAEIDKKLEEMKKGIADEIKADIKTALEEDAKE